MDAIGGGLCTGAVMIRCVAVLLASCLLTESQLSCVRFSTCGREHSELAQFRVYMFPIPARTALHSVRFFSISQSFSVFMLSYVVVPMVIHCLLVLFHGSGQLRTSLMGQFSIWVRTVAFHLPPIQRCVRFVFRFFHLCPAVSCQCRLFVHICDRAFDRLNKRSPIEVNTSREYVFRAFLLCSNPIVRAVLSQESVTKW
jgi:hypothetical protein